MIKIAVLADVHANLPALNAVLSDLRARRADEIWYLGDFWGYGPYPEEVVDLLRAQARHCLAGNYDLKVLAFPDKKKKWKRKKDPAKYFSFRWTHRHLSPESRRFIQQLPPVLSVKKAGRVFLLVHGSPARANEPLGPETPGKRLARLAGQVEADVILCGHSHRFFDRTAGGVRFVNPGSVGRSFDADHRASYALLEVGDGAVAVLNRRVDYDRKEMLRKMAREKFPKELADSVAGGQSLDQARERQVRAAGEKEVIAEVIRLARSCDYEKGHSHQVTQLALKLFDGLKDLHGLGARHRLLLQSASLLHDIGWVKGRVRHHKIARDLILKSFRLPLSAEEKTIVALVARYHRRALPRDTHKYYRDLADDKKQALCRLAALLRVADGLDHGYKNAVRGLSCRRGPRRVILEIQAVDFPEGDEAATLKKADLFREVFGKDLVLQRRTDHEREQ